MKVGVGVVRELLRRIVCLEWCKSAVYEVRYAREVEKGYKRGIGQERVPRIFLAIAGVFFRLAFSFV